MPPAPHRRAAARTSADRTRAARARLSAALACLAGLVGVALATAVGPDPAPSAARAEPSAPAPPRGLGSLEPPSSALRSPSLPVGDLPGWRQTFVEDFSAKAPLGSFARVYGARWTGYEGWRDTTGKGSYAESRVVSVAGGVMDLHLRTEDGQPLVAAPVPVVTEPMAGQLHGRYSVRFRADPVPGYKTAWLLWPDSDDWDEGEVDFPEGDLTGTIWAFNHRLGDPTENALAHDTGARFTDWHTATIEWTPEAVVYLLDGEVVATSDEVPTTPMHWVLQTETELTGPPPPPEAEGHVQVDWVAVYEPA